MLTARDGGHRSPWLVLGAFVSACAAGNAGDNTGDPGEACYKNGTCNGGFVCVEGICTDPSSDAGVGATSAGGTATGGTGGVGGATGGGAMGGAGGKSGAGGTAGTGGTSGAGGSGGCAHPNHLCSGMCIPGTPANGCSSSTDCSPCPEPANSFASCTPGGDCAFSCFMGFQKMGDECVGGGSGGTGGSSGAGGAGGTGGGGTCSGSGCPGTPTNLEGCPSCGAACDSPWNVTWDAAENTDYYEISYTCFLSVQVKNVGNKTTADLCTEVGMCSDALCANGVGAVFVAACNAMGCSAPVQFMSGTPIACGGGVCC